MLFTFASIAQEQQAPRERPTRQQMAERQLTRMTEKLSLVTEQQQKVKSLNAGLAERRESTRGSSDRAQIRVFQLQYKVEMKKILTSEQQVIYEEFEKENSQQRNPKVEREDSTRPIQ